MIVRIPYGCLPPELVRDLTFFVLPDSRAFQSQVRNYNNAVAFASCGATIDRTTQGYQGIFTFRIQGALYHDIGLVFPLNNRRPAFLQIYVVGGNDSEEASLRLTLSGAPLDPRLVIKIQTFLSENNPYAIFYRIIGKNYSVDDDHVQFALRHYEDPRFDQCVYNAPRTLEVGFVIDNDSPNDISPRHIVLTGRDRTLHHITNDFTGYLPLRYPIFFPFGKQGWSHGYPSGTERCESVQHSLTFEPTL
jgi:hypothetical protein